MRGVRHAFRDEIETGLIDSVSGAPGMAVVAVVGDGMAGTPGIAARVFSALEGGGINVVAIAQGSSERNISFVVTTEQAPEAARRVHAAFQLSKIGGGRARARAAHRRRAARLRPGRPRAGRSDRRRRRRQARAHRRPARSIGLRLRAARPVAARLLRLARQKDAGALLAALGGTRASAGTRWR